MSTRHIKTESSDLKHNDFRRTSFGTNHKKRHDTVDEGAPETQTDIAKDVCDMSSSFDYVAGIEDPMDRGHLSVA